MDRYVLLVKAPRGADLSSFRDEAKALAEKYGFEAETHRCIGLTVDAVIVYNNGIVLIKRKNEPFKDHYALPGGFVEYGETVEEALLREVKEETGLDVKPVKLVGVYSRPDRDPRGHTVTVAFLCIGEGELKAGDDAKEVFVFPIEEALNLPLAFDHGEILRDALSLR
ncbi:probable 8-oxo-dGTPase, MutT homolog, NUDIX hydrolase family [Thermococcus kodakarensis KOD1]|uniref:Probable 8-oxo-dGTPase, MutT homolog, NUDIX hydrolase family n=1 Tax=Thermococcus kodakarensis (strain ATCC BAA-918 / JCM 12380 / KOD1) TaxID=69014 RepID=Q5JDA4_THEKO|nr:NUDIX hydrolase [Thermococcus kodakarensis]WCN28107.1 NUDIX hydrolase [Thermococcus kodakarensis]WCN30404.1 NUDIX hydrolase [Thermococcus kodakarensis]BAD86473.1 probable 8-oxo-dGTPase, MutT homolog, NUDIX hydrolase family [Thermococcus kodakarensis KOD1]